MTLDEVPPGTHHIKCAACLGVLRRPLINGHRVEWELVVEHHRKSCPR